MKTVILIILFLLNLFLPEKIIFWSADKKLSWDDFKGKVPSNTKEAANCVSGFTCRYQRVGKDTVRFIVQTYFDKNLSWYKPLWADSVGLIHEQGHFDISELFARELRKEIKNHKWNRTTIQKEVRFLFDKKKQESSTFQKKYDLVTNYAILEAEQYQWTDSITNKINCLYTYSDSVVIIHLNN